MKNLWSFAFISFFLLTSIAMAQPSVGIGVQAGINFANATTSPTSISTTSRTGLMLGGYVDIGLSDVLSIQPGLMYVQKGAEFSVSAGGTTATATWKFDYIELPVLLMAHFGPSEFKPTLFAGPNIGINLKAEAEATSGSQSSTMDLKDDVESIDFALDFGAGGEYQINPTTALFANIRYSLGLSDIDKDGTSSWKSTGVQILVGAEFGI